MSTESMANGAGSGSASFAERMMQKHEPVNGHVPTIEDAVDEEDILHPPPSSSDPADTTVPILVPASEPLSEKALGKQKATEEPSAPAKPREATLDTKSEELFPALGGAPKPRTQGPVATAWGAKKPTSVGDGPQDGTNGHDMTSSATSSRPSTPASGVLTPASTNAAVSNRGAAPQYLSMPGRHTESVQFAPSQLLPRTQLRKPLDTIIRDINKRSKATVEWRHGPGGVLCFEGKGPVDAVRQALKDVAKEVGSKVSPLRDIAIVRLTALQQAIKVPIPASVRPHIIGRQGATIQSISQRTGAKIQVPKMEDSPPAMEDDDSATIDVSIEGDAVAAEMARREIERIANERTSTVNVRLRDIPAELYPFIAGPNDSRIDTLKQGRDIEVKVPHYYSWSHQAPPQPSSNSSPPGFVPHPSSHIQLSGDRRAVQDVRAEIERQAAALRQQITLAQVPGINRGQYQFIVGDGGEALHDLLRDTGCAVILPPESDDSEILNITGPYDRIESGIDRVMELAASMQMSSVDIARQHQNAPMGAHAHARALTRYLQQREAIARLEKMHDSHIVVSTSEDGPVTWEVYSRDGKNNIRAKSDIMNLVNAHPPTRLRHVNMDPFFYQHLQEEESQRIRENYGVHLIIPRQTDNSPQVVLVYEGPNAGQGEFDMPRQRPSQSEIAEFESALQQAQQHILNLIAGQDSIGTRAIDVPSK